MAVGGGVLCSAQLVRKASAPRSTGATILDIVRFDIYYRYERFRLILKDLFVCWTTSSATARPGRRIRRRALGPLAHAGESGPRLGRILAERRNPAE